MPGVGPANLVHGGVDHHDKSRGEGARATKCLMCQSESAIGLSA